MQDSNSNIPTRSMSPISRQTEHNIHLYAVQPREALNRHILELEKEWSIERMIAAGASVLSMVFIVLGALVSPWFLILPAIVSACFLANTISRCSPALTALQGKGRRRGCDIDEETFAMKFLESDTISADPDKAALAERVIAATRAYSSAA